MVINDKKEVWPEKAIIVYDRPFYTFSPYNEPDAYNYLSLLLFLFDLVSRFDFFLNLRAFFLSLSKIKKKLLQ